MAFAYGFGPGWGCGLGFLNFLGTILFFVALVWVVRFLLRGGRFGGRGGWRRWRHGRHDFGFGPDDALDEARVRLARGEIDAREYERLRSTLGGEPSDGAQGPFERWLGGSHDAMQVLRLRLARGEITVEEFETLRRALGD